MKTDGRVGENAKNVKLTEKDVLAIRKLRRPSSGRGIRSNHPRKAHVAVLAARYGVTEACITSVVNRYTWKHLP